MLATNNIVDSAASTAQRANKGNPCHTTGKAKPYALLATIIVSVFSDIAFFFIFYIGSSFSLFKAVF